MRLALGREQFSISSLGASLSRSGMHMEVCTLASIRRAAMRWPPGLKPSAIKTRPDQSGHPVGLVPAQVPPLQYFETKSMGGRGGGAPVVLTMQELAPRAGAYGSAVSRYIRFESIPYPGSNLSPFEDVSWNQNRGEGGPPPHTGSNRRHGDRPCAQGSATRHAVVFVRSPPLSPLSGANQGVYPPRRVV